MKYLFCLLVTCASILLPVLPARAVTALESALYMARDIVDSPTETALCIHPETGALLAQRHGGAESVNLTDRRCYGTVIIHNHPTGAAHLSLDDVATAELLNARALVAVARHGNHVIACALVRPLTKNFYGIGLNRGDKARLASGALRGGVYAAMAALMAKNGPYAALREMATKNGLQYDCTAVR